MNDLAITIQRRTNALKISISYLLKEANVNRDWYEKMKKRTPKSVIAYLKIIEKLTELERDKL